MDIDLDGNLNPTVPNSGVQYEIVDVDDGVGNVEQLLVTNAEEDDLFAGFPSAQETNRRYGKYKPFFNGVIVIGPQIGKLIFVLFCFTTISGILIFLKWLIEHNFSVGCFWLGEGLVLISVVLLLWTSLTDPGVIPKDFNLNQYLLELRRSSLAPDDPVTRPRWCRKCHATRPARCYHCLRCDVCIRRQDMHLLIGGICIGSRNFRQYLSFNVTSSVLSIYLVVVGLSLVIKSIESSSGSGFFLRSDFNGPCFLLFMGGVLLSFPQTGIIMLIYRMYLVSKNRTVREEYRAYLRKDDSNPFHSGLRLNIHEFIFKPNEPSFFRKKKNQINHEPANPQRRWRIVNLNQRSESETLFFPPGNFHLDLRINQNYNRNLNPSGPTEAQSYVESEKMRQRLNAQAKVKLHNSLPLLENGELPKLPGTRFKKSLYSKPLGLIKQQIKHYQMRQALPKSVTSLKKFKGGQNQSLSESSLPQATTDPDSNLILHQARANQIQQIISCVLRRDRRALLDLARRINVAGLIGMDPDNFDPDDIQMIELNNGLPILTARNRRVNPIPVPTPVPVPTATQNSQNPTPNVNVVPPPARRNPTQPVLGIPQLVAAGLMPTIRSQQQQAAASLVLTNGLRRNEYARRLSVRVHEAANAIAQVTGGTSTQRHNENGQGVNDNRNPPTNNIVNLTPLMSIPIQSRYYTTRSTAPRSTSRSRTRTGTDTNHSNNNNNRLNGLPTTAQLPPQQQQQPQAVPSNNNNNNESQSGSSYTDAPIAIVLVGNHHQSTS